MAKRRRRQTDPDVIPTEPDRRRATGKEDEDAFDEPEEEVVAPVINKWTTAANSRYLRLRARQTSKPAESSFPFLLLPAEIRNMIYRYLVISKSPEPIRLDSVRNFRSGGIETAILLANRLVHNEAVKIMYEENECAVCISTWCKGIAFRVDDPKTQDSTSRSLRNGREIDMIKYRGLIYEKVALRLRNIEFRVTLFDRGRMCAHLAVFYTKRMHLALQASYWLLLDLWVQNDREKDKVHRNKSWVIKVLGTGTMSLVTLRNSLRPLVKQTVVDLLGGDDLKMKLQGRYPKGWEAVFHRCVGQKGFDAAGIDEDGELVPDLDVEDYFDFIAEQDYFWDSDFTANGGWAGSAYAESETFTNLDEFDEEDDDDSWDGSDE